MWIKDKLIHPDYANFKYAHQHIYSLYQKCMQKCVMFLILFSQIVGIGKYFDMTVLEEKKSVEFFPFRVLVWCEVKYLFQDFIYKCRVFNI